jgi:hypothetical protein
MGQGEIVGVLLRAIELAEVSERRRILVSYSVGLALAGSGGIAVAVMLRFD